MIDASRHIATEDFDDNNDWRYVDKLIGENNGELIYTSYKIKGNAYMLLMIDEACGMQDFYKVRLVGSSSQSEELEPIIIKKKLESGQVADIYLFDDLKKETYSILIEDQFDRTYQDQVNILGQRLYGNLMYLIENIHRDFFLDVHYPISTLVQKQDSIKELQIVYTADKLSCAKEMIDIKANGNYIQLKEKDSYAPVSIKTTLSKNAIQSFMDFEEKVSKNHKDNYEPCEAETLEIYFNGYYKKYKSSICLYSIYRDFEVFKQELGY